LNIIKTKSIFYYKQQINSNLNGITDISMLGLFVYKKIKIIEE